MNRNSRAFTDLVILAGLALVARGIFLAVVPEGAISADLKAWQRVADELAKGNNPYVTTTHLNWPPVWMQCIYLLSQAAQYFELPLVRVIQFFLMAVELVVLVLSYYLLSSFFRIAPSRYLLFGISLNPILILQVCQHGNFDMVVAALLLGFVICCLEFARSGAQGHWLWSCLLLGLGVLTKTVPFLLLPLLVYNSRSLRPSTKFLGVMLVALPVFIGMSVIFVLAPEAVTKNVLQYRSYPGFYGFTGLLELCAFERFFPLYRQFFHVLLLAVMGGVLMFLRRSQGTLPLEKLLLVSILLLLLLPTFGPGYGPQYICWYLPLLLVWFAVADSDWRMLLAGVFTVAVVTYLIEYAFYPSHGAFLLWLTDGDPTLVEFSKIASSPGGQTMVRLPLFVGYLWLFGKGVRSLKG